MVEPSVIIRTNRRSLSLTIDKNGELIVKAPKRMEVDDIFRFIKQKESWITTKQNLVKSNLMKNKKAIAAGGFRIKMVKNVECYFLFLDMPISPC